MAKGKGRSKVLPIILAILAIAVVAANIAAVMFDSTLDKYAPGGGNPVSVKVAGIPRTTPPSTAAASWQPRQPRRWWPRSRARASSS